MKTNLETAMQIILAECYRPASERNWVHMSGPSSNGKTLSIDLMTNGKHTDILVPDLVQDAPLGYDYPVDGEIVELMLPKIKRCIESAKANPREPHILFFDELNAGHNEVKKVIQSVGYDREVRGHKLPKNVTVVSAGNAMNQSCGVGKTMAHTVNRQLILNLWYEPEGAFKYASSQGWHPDVLAYLSLKPCAWYCVKDDGDEETVLQQFRDATAEKQFPSSRGWEKISKALVYYDKVSARNAELQKEGKATIPSYEPDMVYYAGAVGEERATDFNALRGCQVPSVNDLIEKRAEFPSDPMPKWLCVVNCARALTPGNSEKMITVIRDLNPEMVEVFLTLAGDVAKRYLQEKGKNVPNSARSALLSFPGFKETIFAPGTRYAMALEAQVS